ncbi:13071_t:CDS:2 [Funneliformis caledonium]|uniref:13071_t:CDS:1 n=1 Tax=Funneliformis caledonium TaxID=1117310 RepID=A0A9N9B3R8_9GLOM|nr:13071_t:CDS:2 [Funneliformis caledonium]
MSKNNSIYNILWLLIQLFIEVNCGRDDANTVKIGTEFFYPDVSVPFNTQNILCHDLTNINKVPAHLSAATVRVYSYDTQSNSWSSINWANDSAIRKNNLKAIVDNNGKMYLFGGRFNVTRYNDMLILNTISLKWEIGTTVNAPSPRAVYGAIYVSKQYIIYLGGFYGTTISDSISLSLKEIYYYDMIGNLWLTRVNTGTIPSDRDFFSSVLGLDGQRIIIFEGINNLNNLKPREALYVLDLVNFEWSIPKVSGTIPGSRFWHQANVIERYMVISFGFCFERNVDSDILLLDISNNEEYIWTNIFNPNVINETSPNDSLKDSQATPVIIVAVFRQVFWNLLKYPPYYIDALTAIAITVIISYRATPSRAFKLHYLKAFLDLIPKSWTRLIKIELRLKNCYLQFAIFIERADFKIRKDEFVVVSKLEYEFNRILSQMYCPSETVEFYESSFGRL